MADETDDTEAAAARLEAALERIAALAGAPRPAPEAATTPAEAPGSDGPPPRAEEIAARLDALIDRLRVALDGRPG